MWRIPTLYVEAVGEIVRFRLDHPERSAGEPLEAEVSQPLDAVTRASLQRGADALLHGPGGERFANEAKVRGGILYRALIPPALRAPLLELDGPLLVATTLYGVPWELLHDGAEFWGLRYALGRRMILDRMAPPNEPPIVRGRPRALIVGSDPHGDLPFVGPEVESVAARVMNIADVVCVNGPLATFDTVTAHLSEAFDLIHYCGHVVDDPDAGPALLLARERLLPASVIERTLKGRPLVFLNGCASGRPSWGPSGVHRDRAMSSVAHGFLFGGAIGAVGTLSDVGDRHAAILAERFFDGIGRGRCSIGESLRLARVALRDDPAAASHPTWLSFALHGNPAQVALRSETQEERTRVAPPASGTRRPSALQAALAVVLALMAVAAFRAARELRLPGPAVIGVMGVKALSPEATPQLCRLARDGITTLLSEVQGVKVLSAETLDFYCQARKLCDVELAGELGITQTVRPTLSVAGPKAILTLEIVDLSGVGSSVWVQEQGGRNEIVSMTNRAVLKVIQKLGHSATPELRALLDQRTDEMLELLETWTGTFGPSVAPEGPEQSVPAPSGRSGWGWVAVAHAEEPDSDDAAIRELLRRFEVALEARDIAALAALQVTMPEAQRVSLERHFANARDLEVSITDVEFVVEGSRAVVSFSREDAFDDARTGRPLHLKARLSESLVRQGDTWLFGRAPQPSSAPSARGREIIDTARRRNGFSSWKDRRSTVTMATFTGETLQRTREVMAIERLDPRGAYNAFVRFIGPADVQNTRFLYLSPGDSADEQWLWSPSIRRARRVGEAQREQNFFGTDVAYGDLGLAARLLQWGEAEAAAMFVGEADMDGRRTQVVDIRPMPPRLPYEKYRLWFGAEDQLLWRVDFYEKGAVAKRVTFTRYRDVSTHQTPMEAEVATLAENTKTRFRLEDVRYDLGVDDEFFSVANLDAR